MDLAILFLLIALGFLGHGKFEQALYGSLAIYRSFGHSPKNGRELKLRLRDFFSGPGDSIFLPQYKFFNPLCLELREQQLKHGVGSSAVLGCLRKWLTEDIQFEEKAQSILKNSLAQFGVLSSFTWIFYLNAKYSLGIKSTWLLFTCLQVSGFFSFLFFYRSQKKKHFSFLEELFERAFLFKTLKPVGMSVGEVLLRSKADQILDTKDKQISKLASELLRLSQRWTSSGEQIDKELEELLGEVSFLRDERRRKFELKLGGIRFIHMVVFYLFGYLLVTLSLIRQLALSY